MTLSNSLEALGFLALVAGVYELAGRGWALLALAACLVLLGLAAEGVRPLATLRMALVVRYRRVKLSHAARRAVHARS